MPKNISMAFCFGVIWVSYCQYHIWMSTVKKAKISHGQDVSVH